MRHGSAARTGQASEPAPLWTVRAMFRIGASDVASKAPIHLRSHPLAARTEASRCSAFHAPSRLSLPRASNARMLRERDAIAF
jgi:hypothetical protein